MAAESPMVRRHARLRHSMGQPVAGSGFTFGVKETHAEKNGNTNIMSNKAPDQIKVTHNDVEITYNEDKSRWEFTLRGRERYAESLAKAREAIDKPPPSPKEEEPFERVEAYYMRYYDDIVGATVTITSIAEARYGGCFVWIVNNEHGRWGRKGTREKTAAQLLYPVNAHNTAIIEELKALHAKKVELGNQIEEIKKKLVCYKVPKSAPQS